MIAVTKTPLVLALDYERRGWLTIPIPFGKKSPIIEGWQKLRITKENADQYFDTEPQNIGLLLGMAECDWLVDIDMDWSEATVLRQYFLPDTLIFGRKGNPSSHALVKSMGAVTRKFQIATKEEGGMVLELRSTGCQTVAPGSVHPSGDLVEFENDLPLLEIDADKLERYCSYWAAASVLLRHWVDGIKDEMAAAVAGMLLRGGWKPDRVDAYIERISRAANDKDTPSKLKAERLQRQLDAKQGHVPGWSRLKELIGERPAAKVGEWLGLKQDVEIKAFPTELVMSYDDFAAHEIPQREWVVDGLLMTQSLAMIYGWRGRGKTWLTLSLAVAIASGEPFLHWDCPTKRRLLYVDGEMPAADLQERARQMVGLRTDVWLMLISSEFFYQSEHCGFVLNNADHQRRFLATLETLDAQGRRPEVLAFDNLSSMSAGVDENSNSEMDSLLSFFRELRHLGYAVIVVHHSSKTGDQRGASRREDLLDVVIKLAEPDAPSRDGNAKFKMEFAKLRGGRQPQPVECELIMDEAGFPVWATTEIGGPGEKPMWIRILKYLADKRPASQKQIAEHLDITSAAVSQHLKKLRTKGLLEEGKSLVPSKSGISYLVTAFGDDDLPEF
jgi:archaellum biogenesis ATPase FlaH